MALGVNIELGLANLTPPLPLAVGGRGRGRQFRAGRLARTKAVRVTADTPAPKPSPRKGERASL
jgi:hypothetical protein